MGTLNVSYGKGNKQTNQTNTRALAFCKGSDR